MCTKKLSAKKIHDNKMCALQKVNSNVDLVCANAKRIVCVAVHRKMSNFMALLVMHRNCCVLIVKFLFVNFVFCRGWNSS